MYYFQMSCYACATVVSFETFPKHVLAHRGMVLIPNCFYFWRYAFCFLSSKIYWRFDALVLSKYLQTDRVGWHIYCYVAHVLYQRTSCRWWCISRKYPVYRDGTTNAWERLFGFKLIRFSLQRMTLLETKTIKLLTQMIPTYFQDRVQIIKTIS